MPPSETTAVSVVDLTEPPDLDGPEAWLLTGAADVDQAVRHEIHGNADLAATALDMWAELAEQAHEIKHRLLAVRGAGTVVGTAAVYVSREGNHHLAAADIEVHPAHRRRGIGTTLLRAVEDVAARAGCRTLMVESDHGREPAPDDPRALAAPTGFGRVPGDDPGARFLLTHGFALEQVERRSVLDLPVAPGLLDGLDMEARQRAGDAYRVVTWMGPCPEEWLDQFAVLRTRMSTDVPVAGLEFGEDPWDAARVRADDERTRTAGWTRLVAAAEHVPTRRLVAHTVLDCSGHDERVVFQEDTLVLREHRGLRLGQWVKVANLRRLAAERPRAERVHTGNAEENAPMLRINVALGFRPSSVSGEWQRALTRP